MVKCDFPGCSNTADKISPLDGGMTIAPCCRCKKLLCWRHRRWLYNSSIRDSEARCKDACAIEYGPEQLEFNFLE